LDRADIGLGQKEKGCRVMINGLLDSLVANLGATLMLSAGFFVSKEFAYH
jgi:hypothetical protein